MDYKRAYEELREVYLKDKQTADELAELVAWYFECLDADLDYNWFFAIKRVDNEQIENADEEFDLTVKEAEAALRKAAGKD
jgi:hypothetical protein